MKVSLFIPCIVSHKAPATAAAAFKVLQKLGHNPFYDTRQTCCGQALFNAGFRLEAGLLAERFIGIFAESEAVVAPSGSCVAMVRHHYAALELPQPALAIWEGLRTRIFELSEFLVDRLGVVDVGARFPHRVTLHPACHSLRELGVKTQTVNLLRAVDGLELLGNAITDECCGFGGAFSVKYPALSRRIADRRAAALAGSGVEFITATDDSCLGALDSALRRIRSPVRTIHFAKILASSYYNTALKFFCIPENNPPFIPPFNRRGDLTAP